MGTVLGWQLMTFHKCARIQELSMHVQPFSGLIRAVKVIMNKNIQFFTCLIIINVDGNLFSRVSYHYVTFSTRIPT